MRIKKMKALCSHLEENNYRWEKSSDNHSGKRLVVSDERRKIVWGWFWTAIMHLDAMGYDVVRKEKMPSFYTHDTNGNRNF